jgi:peptidoglycan hydrolase CwlO-like protein
VQLKTKYREANELRKQFEDLQKELTRLKKKQEKTWNSLDISRKVAIEAEEKLKHEAEIRGVEVRKAVEAIVEPDQHLVPAEKKTHERLVEKLRTKEKAIEDPQNELKALKISSQIIKEN